jgi:hypothetical protein
LRVFAHEEGQQFVGTVEVVEIERVEPDVLADEILEKTRRRRFRF